MNMILLSLPFLIVAATLLILTVLRGNRIRGLLKCLVLLLLLAFGASARAQTNQPTLFGNLPPYQTNTTLFTSGKLELRAAVSTGTAYQAVNSLSWFVTQGFALTGDCANGGVNNLNAFHLGGEYAYPIQGIRFTGRAVGGLSLITHQPEGQVSGFISYVPLNASANLFLFAGPSVTLGKSSFQRNGVVTVNALAGVGYRF